MHLLQKLLLLCLPLLVVNGRPPALNINEARTVCIAKCLKVFKSQVTGALFRTIASDPRAVNRECNSQIVSGHGPGSIDRLAVSRCQTCSYACNHYQTQPYSSQSNCIAFCQEVRNTRGLELSTCRGSCGALDKIIKSGQVASQLGEMQTSQPPEIPGPPFAKRPTPAATGDSLVELDWSDYNVTMASADPIVFLVQFCSWKQAGDAEEEDRDIEERVPSAAGASSRWNDLAITTNTELLVEDLAPANWYQFRVAAVSPAGLRGYSIASEPLLKRKASVRRPPEPVRALQEGISRLREGRVDVQILWQPPRPLEQSGQPVNSYKIKWIEIIGTERELETARSQSIPGTQTEYFITNLKPATTYEVSVTAIVILGSKQQLKSRSSIIVVTMQLPGLRRPNPGHANSSREGQQSGPSSPQSGDSPFKSQLERLSEPAHSVDCSCRDRPTTPLVTKQPYYENGDLKLLLLWPRSTFESGTSGELVNTYTIRWSQRVCIESDLVDHGTRQTVVHNTLMLNISGLRFNCHYALQFNGLTKSGQVAFTWNTCFCTNGCKETKIKGNKFPPCPKTERYTMPQPPDNLRVTPLLRATSTQSRPAADTTVVAAQLFWAAPVYPPLRAIIGFRVRWGPRELEEVNPDAYLTGGLVPRMNEALAITSVVDLRERHHLLHSLQPATVYVVTVQTLSHFGDSHPTQTHFTTPGVVSRTSSSRSEEAVQADSKEVQKYFIDSGVSSGALSARIAEAQLIILAVIITQFWMPSW